MHLVALGWIYVVMMMAVAEALSSQGTVLGAVITFVLYGLLPLGLVLYIMGTPGRKRLRAAAEAREAEQAAGRAQAAAHASTPAAASPAPDRSDHAAGDAVAAVRKEL